MDVIFIYLLKANLLIAVFYLAYYFLVQKETFFNSNRWFLLSGLFTSVLIPLFFIKKIVIIEAPKLVATNLSSIKNTAANPVINEPIDWYNILLIGYIIISIFLILKIASELVSFFRLIKNKRITVNKPFAMVDVDENINPFSFFKYIVFNSTKYSNSELENILNHEKVHSKEKHSLDVLIAKIYCTIFWFNPFVWLYKKAIIQNLEYIADQKAIKNIEDKKAYQMTLLKVVTDHNCLSITNSFYQSLIKKRIVMLNKNQSKQKNVWKYALVIPALVAFVIFFQVKVIAQEKNYKEITKAKSVSDEVIKITKETSDNELRENKEKLQEDYAVTAKFSNIKRNKEGQLTSIQVDVKTQKGEVSSSYQLTGDKPIKPFSIVINKNEDGIVDVGFGTDSNHNFFKNKNENSDEEKEFSYLVENNIGAIQVPEPPTPPTPPTPPIPNMENMPKPPTPPTFPTPPNVKAPKDPNDKKAWQKFEDKMQKFEEAWNTEEIKKYEISMKAYEKEMEAYEPDMTAFEKEMEIFESKMEKFEEKMEAYQEKIHENYKN